MSLQSFPRAAKLGVLGLSAALMVMSLPAHADLGDRRYSNTPYTSVSGHPLIDRFLVDAPTRIVAGEEIGFRIYGTRGGQVEITIDGSETRTVLSEVTPGEYRGGYTIKSRDQIMADSAVRLRMTYNGQTTVAQKTLSNQPVAYEINTKACADCGSVVGVRVIDAAQEPGYTGLIAGGVAGAMLGSQIGKGSGKTLGGILGAVGGAYAGREIEGQMKKGAKRYEVTVRMDSGVESRVNMSEDPRLKAGDRVRVSGDRVFLSQ